MLGIFILLLLCLPASAAADTAPRIANIAVSGNPVVGQTLTATATVTGDPTPQVAWRWGRCDRKCEAIKDARSATYVVTADDVGASLRVMLIAANKVATVGTWSDATAVVAAPPGAPPPPPDDDERPPVKPPPPPDPPKLPPPPLVRPAPLAPLDPSSATNGTAFSSTSAPVENSPRPATRPIALMSPFPVVRIRGSIVPRGADVSLLSVRGPRGARIVASCTGTGCPIDVVRVTVKASTTRLRAFETLLPAGLRLEISVTRPGLIGKRTSVLIRRGLPPLRSDRCLMPGASLPRGCPA